MQDLLICDGSICASISGAILACMHQQSLAFFPAAILHSLDRPHRGHRLVLGIILKSLVHIAIQFGLVLFLPVFLKVYHWQE